MTNQEKVQIILERLKKLYPNAKIALDFTNPFELLVATIMSAQTTDKLVNTLTPALFKKYPTPEAMSKAPVDDIAQMISKVNFAGNKAKNIKAASQIIVEKYNGKVPDTMEDLDALPGVARKTANVVLSNAFGKAEGIVIDTHMIRMSQRLGFTKYTDPVKIEQDLMKIVPRDKWIDFAHMLILYGREYATAQVNRRKPGPIDELFIK